MLATALIKQVLQLWHAVSVQSDAPPPSLARVREVLETVFLASLKREEEKPIQATVSLFRDREELTAACRGDQKVFMKLDGPRPFNVESLVKIALAFDPFTTSLAVVPCSGHEEGLEILGALHISQRGGNHFDALRRPITFPDVLTVSSRKSGSLLIFRRAQLIARLNAGRFSRPTPHPFNSSFLGWTILAGLRNHPEFEQLPFRYWLSYKNALERLLIETSKRGTGGTIIWLPEGALAEAQRHFLPKFPLEKGPEGSLILGELCNLQHQSSQEINEAFGPPTHEAAAATPQKLLDIKRRMVEHMELLAQLTRVDGALILNHRFTPLSFGSILTAKRWSGRTLLIQDDKGRTGMPVDLNQYGTRHNSAIDFIARAPGAAAFVISQDGPIAGLTRKDNDTVLWWPDCLSSLWLA